MTERELRDRYRFVVEESKERAGTISDRLHAFNLACLATPDVGDDPVPLEVYALDDAGHLIAGLAGKTIWGWLEIGVIWVEPKHRGGGLGRALMERAESAARDRGCTYARLTTWDVQAPGFYEALGYVPYGRLEGYPPGHTVYYLRKDLLPPARPSGE